MTDLERQLLSRIEQLERDYAVLRQSLKENKKRSEARVFPAEVAKDFGVSQDTIRLMQRDFSGLRDIQKRTETNRIYWHRSDYEAWRAEKLEPVKTKAAKMVKQGLIRRSR